MKLSMKIDAVGVATTNMKRTVEFYTLLGFKFPEITDDEQHLEAVRTEGSARLMIDSAKLIAEINGEEPKPGNHSSFAIEYNSASEVNAVVEKLKAAGFTVIKEPWDAFWGQRYSVVSDPDDYKVDLYAAL